MVTLEQLALSDRRIRVFVASAFRDMQAERDHLVKFVFPQLRKLCEARGVTWGEVDLRWGITEQESERGEVLRLCLEEIDRCRPYFIGLLGDQYGTPARVIDPGLAVRDGWPADTGNRSVTELEIVHAVLTRPESADHAFFYFRDPAYAQGLPEKARQALADADPEAARKLAALKERIRERHREGLLKYAPRDGYKSPEMLGRAIRRDFTRLINQLFPEDQKPDPLMRERLDHEAFAQTRTWIYIGRQEYFDRLDRHVAEIGPPMVVLGESGIGKSALLANWYFLHRESHQDEFVLIHFIGATADSADPTRLLRRIMLELKGRFPEQHTDDVPVRPETIREAFPIWLAQTAGNGRIVLILDGLNQLEDDDAALEIGWLPVVFPPNYRVIVSTLPGPTLDAVRRRQWPELTLRLLNEKDRLRLSWRFLGQHGKRLDKVWRRHIARAPQSANPLFLRALLDELRQFGEHERLGEQIARYLGARDPKELYERILERWARDYGEELVCHSLSLIWAARFGLSESEILDLLGKNGQPLPRARWMPFYLAAEASLIQRSGLLSLSHIYIREAVQVRFLPSTGKQKEGHLRLADYFASQTLSQRAVGELPWHLLQAEAWERLRECVTEVPEFMLNYERTGNFGDWHRYWNSMEKNRYDLSESFVGALARFEASRPSDKDLSKSLHLVGSFLTGAAAIVTGYPLLERALNVQEKLLGQDHPCLAESLGNLGCTILEHPMYARMAEPYLRRSLALNEKFRGADHPMTANSLNDLAGLRIIRKDYDSAERYLRRALDIIEANHGRTSLQSARTLNNLALVLHHNHKINDAEGIFRESLRTQELLLGMSHPSVGLSMENLGALLLEKGETFEATKLLLEAQQIYDDCFGWQHTYTRRVAARLKRVFFR